LPATYLLLYQLSIQHALAAAKTFEGARDKLGDYNKIEKTIEYSIMFLLAC